MKKYKNVLLCSAETIKTYTNIDNNISDEYILPALNQAQMIDLEAILGTQLVRKLQMLVATNSIDNIENEYYQELLDDYITDFLAYSTIVKLIPIISFKIGNSGTVISSDEKLINMSFDEVFDLKDYYQNQADYLQYRLQKYVLENTNKYKELNENKVSDIKSNLYSSANVSIWLGGARGKIK